MGEAKTKPAAKVHENELKHGHAERHWLTKYVFSSDHKIIGIQYGMAGLIFLLIGFCLIGCMRWQMAKPGEPIPVVGSVLQHVYAHQLGGESKPVFENGVMSPEAYNQFGAMHGVIMVFMGIVPLAFAAFGNYVVPLQIGAPDMCFPRVNMASFWCFFLGAVIITASFFIPGGPAQAGWTMYPPLSENITTNGQVYLLVGFILLITSSLLGAVNFIATIIQLRCKNMTWFRLPFFVWAQFVTAFLLLLAFPPLEAAAVMMLMDILVPGTSFFSPTGLMVGGQIADISGGGSPLLYQHLFWFLGHPEVYVLILPAIGIVTEVVANNVRRPIWGYKLMVASVLVLGFLSFIVWAHHMYMTGMSNKVATFFQTTTMIISIPSVILLTCLFMTLWKGSIRFNTPAMFALAFLPMFGIGGLTGLPLGFNFTDIHLHDTYYVIAHFHYVVAPGTIFAMFAGVYYWYPKMTGTKMNEFWGRVHFWCSLTFMNLIFMPMFAQGMDGMIRRMSDGGATYAGQDGILGTSAYALSLNQNISHAVWALGLSQIPFIINFFWSIRNGEKVNSDNPWESTTLEWQTPTPPPHGNFPQEVEAHRESYEYSNTDCPGHPERDFWPQNEPAKP